MEREEEKERRERRKEGEGAGDGHQTPRRRCCPVIPSVFVDADAAIKSELNLDQETIDKAN